MPDLLFEIGVEEIPAGYLRPALDELKQRAEACLKAAGLQFQSALATGTPRRLVLAVTDLPHAQAAREEELSGPPEDAAFKDGEPTKAAEGFARKSGVEVSELYVKDTPRGRYVHARKRSEGRATGDLLCELLPPVVEGLSWPKSMRWPQASPPPFIPTPGEKKKKSKRPPAKTFVRPVRRVLCLLGNQVLPVEVFGIRAARATCGHPYIVGDRPIALERADFPAYRALLKGHGVIADRNERRALIRRDLEDVYARHEARLRHDELLEEVTDLVELPTVLEGSFSERYLQLPPEIIDAAMTEHQRYFPIYGDDGRLRPGFVFVADRPERCAEVVAPGNERVLGARLEDAMFYLTEDLKTPLAARETRLAGVTFHEKLGTLLDRTRRLERLASRYAGLLGLTADEVETARRAGGLAKADLTTDLVAEFPKLQGAIGAEYARRQGEASAVCLAIREHYLPRFSGDLLPQSPAGLALSLAERLDNLACFFAIGEAPTGSADPFALRRQALGVVRIVAERKVEASIPALVRAAVDGVPVEGVDAAALEASVLQFLSERFAALLREQGLRRDLVDAVLASRALESFPEVERRAAALTEMSRGERFPELVELVERTFNISRPLDEQGNGLERRPVREDLLSADEEKALFGAWQGVLGGFRDLIAEERYQDAADAYLGALASPVHEFFDKVFVNVDDLDVRLNRLGLLRDIHDAFARGIADLCKVVMEGGQDE